MSVTSDSLINKLVSSLKIDDLWIQFLEGLSEEIISMRNKESETKDYFNVDKQLEDGLITIANDFGYNPNLIVDNSLQMVKKEVESIPTRIRNKTTYQGYYIILKQIGKIGEVYNFYWSGKKLIRAIKWSKLFDYLNTTTIFTEPFPPLPADKNFSTISKADAINLDTSHYLDELLGQWHWLLDENVEVSPTKHLGIEYSPRSYNDLNNEDTDSLILKKYFRYLSTGIDYNKRVPIIPHVGIQIIGMTQENSGSNFFDRTADYSIPKLKLNCIMGYNYNKNFLSYGGFTLDEGQTLNELIKWYLDKEVSTTGRPNIEDFKYISCGKGVLHTPTESQASIFPFSKLILFYTFNDDDSTYTIKDYSINNKEAEIVGIGDVKGQTKKVEGIISRTVNFDGITSVKMKSTMDITLDNISFGFWMNPNAKDYYNLDKELCIVDFDFFKVFYNYKTEFLRYTFSDIEGVVPILHETVSNIIFELDTSTNKFNTYVNAQLWDTQDILNIPTLGANRLYIGSDSNNDNKFIGIIDSLWMLNKILTENEKQQIYNEKVSLITHLANRLAYFDLDTLHEIKENKSWRVIQSYVKANEVNNEFVTFAQKSIDEKESKVNLFYNGFYVKDTMKDTIRSANKYKNFGFEKFYAYKYSETYLYTEDKETFYIQYSIEEDLISFSNEFPIENPELLIDTGYAFYMNVTKIDTTLIPTFYQGKTSFAPIEPKYFSIFYKTLAENGIDYNTIEIKTSRKGTFYRADTNEDISGKINFETGEYLFNSLTERYSTQEILKNILSEDTHYICYLQCNPNVRKLDLSEIKPRTLKLVYTLNGNTYEAKDNGEGIVAGYGIESGIINYNEGYIDINFVDALEGDFLANYTYLENLNMVEGTPITFKYKVKDIPITEIGLENENHELLAYMTFPPVEFDTYDNYISSVFLIKKIDDGN